MWHLGIFIYCLLGIAFSDTSLNDYEVVSVSSITTENEFQLVQKMVEAFDLDVWTSRREDGEMDIMIRKDQRALFDKFNVTVLHSDIQSVLDQSKIVEYDWEAVYQEGDHDPFYDDYRSYEQQLSRMQSLCTSHSSICSTFVLGKTVEGRDMHGVHIEGGSGGKELVFIGNIHAREWVAPATVLYILEQLLVQYDTNSEVKKLVDDHKFTIVPVFNVDGRIFSETTSRMWRKNRRNNGGSFGIDLNRNFDYKWGGGGSSGDPTSDAYRGPSALSEPEAAALRSYVCEHKPEVFIDYHTSGNMFMSTWGYNGDYPAEYSEMMNFGKAGTDAIENTHNTKWKLGTSYHVIYQTSGSTGDTTYGSCGVVYSYCLELRGPGFSPPPSNIRLSCEENWNGVVAMGKYLSSKV